MIYSPSIACADQLNLEKEISEMLEMGIEMFHFDIMDGHYVPNICLSVDTVKQVNEKFKQLKIDIHLLVTNPEEYIERFKDAGADSLAFHISSTNFAYRTVQKIKNAGMKAGVAINPSEPIILIDSILKYLDFVLIMSIEPGFAGTKYIDESYEKIKELISLRKEKNLKFKIMVDGGITPEVGKRLKQLEVDILVLGYLAIFKQPDGIKGSFSRFMKYIDD